MAPINSSDCFKEIYERNADTVYHISLMYLKNTHDAEDAVHNTFLKLLEAQKTFESESHEKAWLIKVCVNICKNVLSHWSRKNLPIDEISNKAVKDSCDETLIQLSALPEKLKTAVYLHYYCGYNSKETGEILHISDSAVRNRLQRARNMLKDLITEDAEKEANND